MIYIIAAMSEELAHVKEHLPLLKTVCTGVGKVNAALAIAPLVDSHSGSKYRDIIVVGTSGAADSTLQVGDVVICSCAVFHDVDVTPLGFAPGQIPYEQTWKFVSNEVLSFAAIRAAHKVGCRTHTSIVATGDRFVGDPDDVAHIHTVFNAAAIDMETAAVAMTINKSHAFQHGLVRWTSIRVISDRADKSAPVDFPVFLPQAAHTIGNIVREIMNTQG